MPFKTSRIGWLHGSITPAPDSHCKAVFFRNEIVAMPGTTNHLDNLQRPPKAIQIRLFLPSKPIRDPSDPRAVSALLSPWPQGLPTPPCKWVPGTRWDPCHSWGLHANRWMQGLLWSNNNLKRTWRLSSGVQKAKMRNALQRIAVIQAGIVASAALYTHVKMSSINS